MLSGIQELPVMIGVFAISEVFFGFLDADREQVGRQNVTGLLSGLKDMAENWKLLIKTSLWGTFLGALPGVGATTAAIIGYDEAKRGSKHKELMGQGQPEGVIGPECANNAVTGGALIPMLALGIPGDPVTAILLGGLMIHGLRPGPELFKDSPQVVYGIYISIIISYLIILVFSMFSIKLIARLLNIKSSILSAFVLVFCIIGVYALQNSYFDIYIAIAFGLIGFFMRKHGFELGPFTLAFVLGRIIESKMGLAIRISRGNWLTFFTRPISCVLLVVTFLFIALSAWRISRKRRVKNA
jgi:putative tricarboxylic transport membrane protein